MGIFSRNKKSSEPITEAATGIVPLPGIATPRRGIEFGYEETPLPIDPIGGSDERSSELKQYFDVYISCPWASACIDVIARTASAGGLSVIPYQEGQIEPPAVKQLEKLFSYVNDHSDIRELLRQIIVDMLVFGDAFVEVVWLMGAPVALYTLDPVNMSIEADSKGNITGYVQTTDKARVKFKSHEVIHISSGSPRGGLYGISALRKVIMPIRTWLFTASLLEQTMKKGDPPHLAIDMQSNDPNSAERFRQGYVRNNLGAKNIGNPILGSNHQIQELKVNRIAEYGAVLNQKRDEILSGTGVPPSKVNVIEAGNIGGGTGTSQDKTFRINTCGPYQKTVSEKFNYFFLKHFGLDPTEWHIEIPELDWRDDETVEKIRDMRLRNGSWTVNRYRRDIGEDPIDGGDEAVLINRQNTVLWKNIDDMSDAIIASKVAGAQAATAKVNNPPPGGAKATKATPGKKTPQPVATKSLKVPDATTDKDNKDARIESSEEEDTYIESLLGSWEQSYKARRRQALKELPKD